MKSDRLLALGILNNLISGKGSLSSQLSAVSAGAPDANLPLIQEFTYGVCRWYDKLTYYTGQLLEKPLRKKDADIHCLILLGLYQLFYMRTPDHATINETVAATRQLKKPWAKNLVNAVLRQAQRDRESLAAQASENDEARYSHPRWLLDAFRQDWPDHMDSLIEGNNLQAPLVVRVNTGRCSREEYLAMLAQSGMTARSGQHTETAVILDTPVDVSKLPGFAEGLVSVQDEASQLAAAILGPEPGTRVLDACAAPGGKTCALLELADGKLNLTALDNHAERLGRVQENLDRLVLNAQVVCADAAQVTDWWDNEPFDAILLDAPCSGTGVIRRHPDIKLLRQPGDIARLGGLQLQLLRSLWPCLKPGGRLLYTTCSVLRAENEVQVSRFLAETPDAAVQPLVHAGTLPCTVGMQFLPGAANTDGFYYALLKKMLPGEL